LNSRNLQEIFKNLQIFYKCPSCGSNYRLDDIKFLGQVGNHCFMQLSCHHCSLPVLATVFLSSQDRRLSARKGKKKVPTSQQTDLNSREKTYFAHKAPISSSEIAQLYLYLDNYPGNLEGLSKK